MFAVPLIIGLAVAAHVAVAIGLVDPCSVGPLPAAFPDRYRDQNAEAAHRRSGVADPLGHRLTDRSRRSAAAGWSVVDRLYGLIGFGVIGAALLVYHWWLVDRRKEMSATGELAGIFGLALGAPLAYYTASGKIDGTALALWIVNALYFGGTVFYIKLKVRQQPRLPAPDRVSERLVKAKACLTYQSVVLTIVIVLVALQDLPALVLLAFVPMTLKMVYGATRWQDKQSLSLPKLGVIEIFHAVTFAVLIVAAFSCIPLPLDHRPVIREASRTIVRLALALKEAS